MRKITFISGLLLINLLLLAGCQNKETGSIIAEGATVQLLADGFSFTEGPIADKKGNVYFTDQPNNKIYKWSTAGELSVF
jgi:gluconolactonase